MTRIRFSLVAAVGINVLPKPININEWTVMETMKYYRKNEKAYWSPEKNMKEEKISVLFLVSDFFKFSLTAKDDARARKSLPQKFYQKIWPS